MEVEGNKSMEELEFIRSAVSDPARRREPFTVKYMCDKKCSKEGFKFEDIAAILVEDDGKPHKINLCRNCYNLRLAERNESKVTNAGWKTTIEQKITREQAVGRLGNRWLRQQDVGEICSQEVVGKEDHWKRRRERCRWEQAGRMRHRTKTGSRFCV